MCMYACSVAGYARVHLRTLTRTATRVCICYGGGRNKQRERERERESKGREGKRERERDLPPNFARFHMLTGPDIAHHQSRRPRTRARLLGALTLLLGG